MKGMNQGFLSNHEHWHERYEPRKLQENMNIGMKGMNQENHNKP